MEDLKQVFQTLIRIVGQLQTHRNTVNGKISLCFDKSEKIAGKHGGNEGLLGDVSHHVKHIDEGEVSHNDKPFPKCYPNMLARLSKVLLNKFDGSYL
jgi:hypothetical protein